MAVDPLVPGGPQRPDTQRLTESTTSHPVGHAKGHGHHHKSAAASTDQVELSDAAATQSDGDIPSGTLTPEQLQSITRQLADGSLDGPAVHDRIAGQLLGDGEITASDA